MHLVPKTSELTPQFVDAAVKAVKSLKGKRPADMDWQELDEARAFWLEMCACHSTIATLAFAIAMCLFPHDVAGSTFTARIVRGRGRESADPLLLCCLDCFALLLSSALPCC